LLNITKGKQMGISAEQRKALEAAGYTVSGKTVKTKDGKSIGGYNENGKIWSGSSKVKSLLTTQPSSKPVAAPKARPRPAQATPTAKPVAKDPMKGYRAGDVTSSRITPRGGRGDGGAERITRAVDKALANVKPKKEKRVPGRAAWLALTRGGNPKNYLDERKNK
jgi:hypothetical protein